MRGLGWSGRLGMVDTIFEEETEDLQSLSSPALSPPFSSPSTPDLHTSVETWTEVSRKKPDVKILVQGVCFCLHKDAVTSKSGYLRRQLKEVSELILSPPLKVTVEAFKLFAHFCYQCDVVLTPFNVAPLRTAVDLLEVAAESRDRDGDNLIHKAESYFSRCVLANRDLCVTVFFSSLPLLPEAEELASLPSRCLEALSSLEDSDGVVFGVSGCADCVKAVRPAEFQIIAESMQRRFSRSHDLLYKLIDLYFKVYDEEISEEQKTRICNFIDCNMLSPEVLVHSVQNPRMPLRFIVRAMLMEQLNTHRSISFAVNSTRMAVHHDVPAYQEDDVGTLSREATTLGALLQRDAALQQVGQLRAAMDNTTSRIQSLENELTSMKLRLVESEQLGDLHGRSVSCRFNSKEVNKVERGERGSISSSNLRFKALPPSAKELVRDNSSSPNSAAKNKKNLGQRLMKGLKSALRVSSSSSKKESGKPCGRDEANGVMEDDDALAALVCIGDGEENHCGSNKVSKETFSSSHHRSYSLS